MTHPDLNNQAERAEFEEWCIRKGYSTNKWGGIDAYVDSHTQNGWEVWRAARSAAPPALDAEGLPPLPGMQYENDDGYITYSYTTEQIQQYARDAVEADRRAQAARIAHLTYERDKVRADCAQLARQSAPEGAPVGMVLVPTKITEEMHVAAVRAIIKATGNDDFPPAVWSAMIAAAPQPARQDQQPAQHGGNHE